jgi:diaminopimelate epimerase
MRFTKMHGCGNDYVFIDGWREALPPAETLGPLARRMSDRHCGVGSDGLIIVEPPVSHSADARMRMFNSDGSMSEMCGNGLRCAAKLAFDHGHVRQGRVQVETGAGLLPVELIFDGSRCIGARVEMGRPRLLPSEVPVEHAGPGPLLRVDLAYDGGRAEAIAVGMGNPHAVIFVPAAEAADVMRIGPRIETHPLFPRRTNVEFVSVLAGDGMPLLRQRTWERGAGETQACGTGACAATVAAILDRRIAGRTAIVRLNGGELRVSWPSDDAAVTMEGPAVSVFEGDWPTT